MRKITTLLLIGLAFMYAAEGFAQRGIGTNLPDRSSVLHLESGTRGLLIPRFDLTAIADPSPVTNPANSLLVYNTATVDAVGAAGETGLRPGYYYWKRDDEANAIPGQWIPLLNTAGNNIMIDDNGVVSVKPGESAGEVLVTVLSDPDDSTSELTTEWMSFEDFIKVIGENGVTVVPETDPDTGITTYTVELGGTLNRTTEIITEGEKFEIKTGVDDGDGNITPGENFFISNLNEIEVENDGTITGTGTTADPNIPGDTDTPGDTFKDFFDVLIVNKDTGLVQRVSVEDLLKNAIEVESGLHYDDTDGKIKLGGELTKDAEIILENEKDFIITRGETSEGTNVGTPGEFKIVGLEETVTANKIMVVDENNVVKTVRRVISKDINTSASVEDPTTDYIYSPYVQEVNITVSGLLTVAADIDLTLPAANAANEGQVINVSLTNETEPTTHTHALVIKDSSGADVTWGALPFQGWVLKSDGSKWRVVSSN